MISKSLVFFKTVNVTNFQDWHLHPVVLFGPTVEPEDTEEPFLTKDPWQLSSDKPWIAGLSSAVSLSKAFSEWNWLLHSRNISPFTFTTILIVTA